MVWKTPGQLAYGGDWNPEQWSPETLNEDFQLMHETNVNLVSLGIFSWAKLEPKEGEYDFTWMKEILDRCHAEGIHVDLATPTAAPPAWLLAYENTAATDKNGIKMSFGSRQEYCPTSEKYRTKAAEIATRLGTEFGDHPAVVMWHVNNEYGCHTLRCYCDNCATGFRAWLKEKYGTIEAVNQAWVTAFWSNTFQDFSEVNPPRKTATYTNPAHELDYWRYCDDQQLENFKTEANILRRLSPGRPVTTNFMGEFANLNYGKWAEHIDVISDDDYPDPANPVSAHQVVFNAAMMRGYAKGQPFLLMEQVAGAVQWRPENTQKRPGQYQLWSLSRVAHGANGILQFQWRQSPGGAETFHNGMVNHAGKFSKWWPEVCETGRALQRLEPVAEQLVSSEAVVLIDSDSARARHLAIGPREVEANFQGARLWHRALWEKGVVADVLSVRSLLRGDNKLDSYKLIVVPDIFIDYPELAKQLDSAAAGGAQVIVTKETGVTDENLKAILGGYLGSLKKLLGVQVTDHHLSAYKTKFAQPDPRVSRITSAIGTPGAEEYYTLDTEFAPLQRALQKIALPTPQMRGHQWGENVIATQPATQVTLSTWLNDEVEVIAQFSGHNGSDLAGWPAITRRRHEQGAGWYVATDLDEVGKAAFLEVVCAYARISTDAEQLPAGVEKAQRGNVCFYLNHSDKAVQLAGVSGFELLTQSEATGHVMLPPRTGIAVQVAN
ncbi:beta-galactosidase trimerization domain protein [Gleimia coleocanis DSM 15436]|uniref:Beta-galactosidase n=1 Tax=Gleimia coleocanis DSM 15436 TaxID=525245 RepID=C0W0S0_9ACTO|nr:beta-galactosidase [Gleimia coleocanis]EEH63644.1 beta-galactosidase trimerization domain protein [Gleimia coleocanis DSM 15436]